MTKALAFFILLRPKQWVKNFFVFAPLIFARELFMPEQFATEVKAFIAFCLTASAGYILNDIADAETDRTHPEKRHRPIAAGTVTRNEGGFLLIVLAALTIFLATGMSVRFLLVLGTYFVMNVFYSFKLKEIVLLDVFLIAAGFMLRVLGGAYAIDVTVSSWIVLCTMFVSLFLGFAKRRGELVQTQGPSEGPRRKVLDLYRVQFIDQMLTIAAAGTVISYALYTVAPRTVEIFGTEKMIYTTVFVLFGVFRYLYLIHTTTTTENPTRAVTTDPAILVTGVLWILTCIILIYGGIGIL